MFNANFYKYLEHPVSKKVLACGPKRVLALDGGGVRGALTIGFLEELEAILRMRFENTDMVLSDYFDLIGGSSTGAIIATMLSRGYPVAKIKKRYLNLGKIIFGKKLNILAKSPTKYMLPAEYDESILEEALADELGTLNLGHQSLRTGLVIFSKRADTYSLYGFHNHPRNAYYEENKNILLADLLRASSAAPSYFTPKELIFENGESGVFIDGGVSGVNNPSLMLFLMATIKGYGYQWQTGEDNLLLVSIGTGYHQTKAVKKEKLLKRSMVSWVPDLPDLFMVDATEHNQMLLQFISNPVLPETINREVGDLSNDLLTKEPLLTYFRYNALLEKNNLNTLGMSHTVEEIASLRKMENGQNVDRLYQIGAAQAKKMMNKGHLPAVFDFGVFGKNKKILTQKEAKELFIPYLNAKGKTYAKQQSIHAYQATKSEKVISITSFGKETKNTAEPGDYIVTNQTSAKERYVIKQDKFASRYAYVRDLGGKQAEYRALGKIRAVELTAKILQQMNLPPHFEIIADWNEYQYAGKDDFIVCPLDGSEVYRIAKEEFKETYVLE
ncbi:MAG: patatin-like phospholipase family protein [Bacteroidota bacterium]